MFERYRERPFRYQSTSLTATAAIGRALELRAKATAGQRPNYYPAAGPPLLSRARDLSATITIKPGSRWRLAETYILSRLSTMPTSGGPAGDDEIFADQTLRTRMTFQVSRPLSVRVIADYNNLRANAALVDLGTDRRWNLDLLATYLLHPGTALYVGYSSRRERFADSGLPMSGTLFTERGQQIFVKTSVSLRR